MSTGTFTLYTIQRPEGPRTYYEYVPLIVTNPAPLVIASHGHGGSPEGFIGKGAINISKWDNQADTGHFIVLAGQALGGSPVWNADGNLPQDDYGFILAMIKEAKARRPIDATRIYATGYSNGAGFTGGLATRFPGMFAAVAMVDGDYTAQALAFNGPMLTPMPVLKCHGTADTIWPEAGQTAGGLTYVPIDTCNAQWNVWLGLDPTPTVGSVITDATNGSSGQLFTWTRADALCEQQFWQCTNMGHQYPGGGNVLFCGNRFMGIDFTALAWTFFQRWTRQGQIAASISANDGTADVDVTGQTIFGVDPEVSTVYTLNVSNLQGTTLSAPVLVSVAQPVTLSGNTRIAAGARAFSPTRAEVLPRVVYLGRQKDSP